MLVFLAHAGLPIPIPGNFGVTVFFFLSGYLITTLLRLEFDKQQQISFRAFYLRRTLRILPVFYLVLALAWTLTAAGWLGGPRLSPYAMLAQTFHLTNYYVVSHGWWEGLAPGTWVYWSLAVEEHFYLAFPLLYLLLRRRLSSARRQAIVLAALCAVVLLWRCILVFGLGASRDRTYIATDTRIDSILFGCILAVYGNPALDRGRQAGRRWMAIGLPLGIAGLLVSFAIQNQQFQETFRYTLQGVSLVPLFVAAIRYPNRSLFRLLNLGWVRFVGLLSYSLYLVHPTVIFGVQQWVHRSRLLQGLLALALSLLLSIAIYHVVEKPCTRLRKRLSQIGKGPAVAAADLLEESGHEGTPAGRRASGATSGEPAILRRPPAAALS